MDVEVVVLGEGSIEVMLRWTVRERSQAVAGPWQQLALDMVRRAREGRTRIGEVYLCYRGERTETYYDRELLEILITLSRQHAWGSEIHVVLDGRRRVSRAAGEHVDSIEEWLGTALRAGATDFLQVLMDPSGREPVDPVLLRSACDRARSIAKSLGSMATGNVWEVALTGRGRQREEWRDLLASFVRAEGPAGAGSHLVIVLSDSGESRQQDAVETALQLFQPARATVALVGVRPEEGLWDSCEARQLGLVWFRGLFELKYFLLRSSGISRAPGKDPARRSARSRDVDEFTYYEAGLREVFRHLGPEHPRYREALVFEDRLRDKIRKARHDGDTDTLMAQRAEIVDRWNGLALGALGVPFNRLCDIGEAAEAAPVAALEVVEPAAGGALLLTTSLDPESQAELCLLAARIVGRLLLELPPSIVPCVQLALNRTVLGDMIDDMPAIAGWIFIGTAAGERGLPEAPSGELRSPEEWSACFGRPGPGIPLAMFLAGDSVEVARRFARCGAAVCAIGFQALAQDLVSPARGILRTVLNGRSERSRIESIVGDGSRGGAFFAEGR